MASSIDRTKEESAFLGGIGGAYLLDFSVSLSPRISQSAEISGKDWRI